MTTPEDVYIKANAIWMGWLTERLLRLQDTPNSEKKAMLKQVELEQRKAVLGYLKSKNLNELQSWLEMNIAYDENKMKTIQKDLTAMKRMHTIVDKYLKGEYNGSE